MKLSSIITSQTATNGFLFTASSYASLPVVLAKEADQEPKLVRPKDLSIYPEEPKEKKIENDDWKPTMALGAIQSVRQEIVNLNQQLSQVKDRAYTFVQTGISHTESFVDDLRQENNSALRAGFVAGGGLAGLLLAVRKGKFKKLIYTTAGVSSAYYVGYPKESEQAIKVIKRYSTVSYHLINNVTKDLTGFELPPLPVPKSEPEAENYKESKPEFKEFLFSLVDQAKEQLDSLKKIVFNDKNEPDDKGK